MCCYNSDWEEEEEVGWVKLCIFLFLGCGVDIGIFDFGFWNCYWFDMVYRWKCFYVCWELLWIICFFWVVGVLVGSFGCKCCCEVKRYFI